MIVENIIVTMIVVQFHNSAYFIIENVVMIGFYSYALKALNVEM